MMLRTCGCRLRLRHECGDRGCRRPIMEIAATLNGWASSAIFAAYEAERQTITDQVSRFTTEIAVRIMKQRRKVPAGIEMPGPEGDR